MVIATIISIILVLVGAFLVYKEWDWDTGIFGAILLVIGIPALLVFTCVILFNVNVSKAAEIFRQEGNTVIENDDPYSFYYQCYVKTEKRLVSCNTWQGSSTELELTNGNK